MSLTTSNWKLRILIFLFSALSIASLLLYFLKAASFERLTVLLLSIEFAGLIAIAIWARLKRIVSINRLLLSALWAGSLATLAYDIVRVPVALAGIPVFKAISYFGTVLLQVESPTRLSEFLGWSYHLSNGISFGLMYAALIKKPGPITAVIWGLTLEAIMLQTPYAEVFGYRRDAKFLAITIGAHAIYGVVLWLCLSWWSVSKPRLRASRITAGFLCAPLGLSVVAADFHNRYAAALPPSPPPSIGSHVYTTWNVPEPDRIVAMWIVHRFVEPQVKFHFIPPFENIKYGEPFDLPEAEIRRHGMQSATEFLLEQKRITSVQLGTLARMTHLNEVTPWMLASDVEAGQLTQMLREEADRNCGTTLSSECLPKLFSALDKWYDAQRLN